MVTLKLTQDEAYTSITGLYETIARKLNIVKPNAFECRKVRVGENIMNRCREFCMEQKGIDRLEFNMAWLQFGPKAMLDDDLVECDDGWYV